MPEHLATQLIATSLNFVTTRRAFEIAIDEARRAGWPDDEVCRVTGLSRHTVEAVAGRRHDERADYGGGNEISCTGPARPRAPLVTRKSLVPSWL